MFSKRFRVQGFRVQALGFLGLKFRVLGFRDLRLRVLGLRVWTGVNP